MAASIALAYDEMIRAAVDITCTGLPRWDPLYTPPTAIVQRSSDTIVYQTVRGMAEAPIDSGTGALEVGRDWEFVPDVVSTYRLGTTQTFLDNFQRADASGTWGSPDVGDALTTGAAQYSIASNKGKITHTAANTGYAAVTARSDYGDGRFEAEVTLDFLTVTGAAMRTELYARRVDSSNYYRLRLEWKTNGDLDYTVVVVNNGIGTTLISDSLLISHDGLNTRLRLVIDVQGIRLRAAAYDPTLEPFPGYLFDEDVPTANRIGAGAFAVGSARNTGNTNTNAATVWSYLQLDVDEPYWLDSDTITPTVSSVYLESVMRSFLNVAPCVVDYTDPTRTSRGTQDYVQQRTLPLGRTELGSSRKISIALRTINLTEARTLEYLLSSGDMLFLQVPSGCPIPRGHYMIDGDAVPKRPWPLSTVRRWDFDLIEVAAPGPDVITAQSTWDDVIALYGTWADVVSAQPTWEDLLELVGDPATVVVP